MPIKPELLAPAGDLEKLRTAIAYGADAVYLGGRDFSLRAGAGNFDEPQLLEGLYHAHSHGVRVYVTLNIFARNSDLEAMGEYAAWLAAAGVDAVIVADPGVFRTVKHYCPQLEIHISTQANCSNKEAAAFWHEAGARRVVLARECSLAETEEIHRHSPVELEAFIHGAMCMAWSGRCLISSHLVGRSANRGDCAQPCRWQYHLVEEQRPGEYMPVEEDSRGTYILNARDLCMLPHIGQLAAAGVTGFKIEGRMKSVHYLATVVNAYRVNIDRWWQDPAGFAVEEDWMEELAAASHRPWSTGFYFGNPGADGQHTEDSQYRRFSDFVAVVRGWQKGRLLLEQRGKFAAGETLELLIPGSLPRPLVVKDIQDSEGASVQEAPHAQQQLWLEWPEPVPEFTVVRRRKA